MILVCLMERQIIEDPKGKSKIIFEKNNAYFQSRTYINDKNIEVKDILKNMIKEILATLAIYQENGSGWYFEEVESLEIHLVDYKPFKGGSYIPLPEFIQKKNAIINIKNEDDKCFLWSVLRYLHPVQKNGERISDLKKYENDLNFKQIRFPVQVKDITKFENQNPYLPGINVFSVNDNNKVYPLRTNQKDCKKTIDLFFHSDGEKEHYSFIKNFSRLVRSQITSHSSSKIYICKKCLSHYTKEYLLEKHITYCGNNETAVVKMPTKKNGILKFKHHFQKLPLPFIIYADFECFTIPVNSCQPNPEKSHTKTYQKHEPSGFCLYLKSLDAMSTNFKPIVNTKKTSDEDISKKFIVYVVKLTHKIYKDYYKKPKPYNLTVEEEKEFQSASTCHICEEVFTKDKKSNNKVRDHCHFTGKYRGAAHNQCNLSCRKPMILPVIFHNLQGYDAHLFIKQLAKVSGDLTSIPTTEEKYITFSKFIAVDQYHSKKHEKVLFKKFEIRFIDSFKFLQTSLSNLVSNLQPSDFSNLQKNVKTNSLLLTRKGVYPYDYVTSIENALRKAINGREADLGFTLSPRKSRRHPAKALADLDFADDIVLLSDDITRAQALLTLVEKECLKIGLTSNAKKTKVMSVNLPLTALQSANGIPLETVDDFKYLGSWVNSTNQDIRVRKAMAWKALNGMNVVWRSSLSRDLKIRFFRATVESILLYGSECWSLNSSSRKSLDGTYTRMLRTVLNINWRDHAPNVTLYGDLPRLTDRIAWRRLGIAGHCYRHRELPASQLVLWEPTHGRRKPGRPPTTFLNILQDDIGATTSAELPACMKDRKDWNLRREARLRPP